MAVGNRDARPEWEIRWPTSSAISRAVATRVREIGGREHHGKSAGLLQGQCADVGAGCARSGVARAAHDLAKQCEIVQGVLVHRDMAPWLYDLKLTEQQRDDGNIRGRCEMLERIHAAR